MYCANSAVLCIDDVIHFTKFCIHGIYDMYVWVCGNFNCSFWASKTGAGLLQQVKSRLDVSEAPQDEDSFSLFLYLLGKHLNSCLSQTHQRHWQQMKGRIYSKFSPNKLLALTEMGLYHFVSLFLTLAITVDLQEVVSASHIYTELFSCCVSISDVFYMVSIMWNTLNEWTFFGCGSTFEFIQGVLFLLFYLMGLTDVFGEIKGHESLDLWIGFHVRKGQDEWHTADSSHTPLL